MTRKDEFAISDQPAESMRSNPRVFHRHEKASEKGLDSRGHRSNTVRALRNLSLSTQEMEENMGMIRLLNIDQVCAVLNMGRVKVYELINRKRLKSIKIGARRLVSTRALNDFIDRLEE